MLDRAIVQRFLKRHLGKVDATEAAADGPTLVGQAWEEVEIVAPTSLSALLAASSPLAPNQKPLIGDLLFLKKRGEPASVAMMYDSIHTIEISKDGPTLRLLEGSQPFRRLNAVLEAEGLRPATS